MRRARAGAGRRMRAAAGAAGAWPAPLVESIARDARRLVPESLGVLMSEREKEIFEASQRLPPELTQALSADLVRGELSPATLAVLDAQAQEAVTLLRAQKVSEGIIKLGSLLRIPADLSDPVLSVGAQGYPLGVTQEYYSYVNLNLKKIPVVLESKPALRLARRDLPVYWQGPAGPQPQPVGGDPDGAVPARAHRGPPHDRLPEPGVRRRLAVVLARRHRHRGHLAGGVARGARRRRPRMATPSAVRPRAIRRRTARSLRLRRPSLPRRSETHERSPRDPLRLPQGRHRRAGARPRRRAASRSCPPAAPPRSCGRPASR